MTGFGSGEASAEGVNVTLELRAVNHRFLDVAMKLPSAIAFLESDIRAYLKDTIARGRVTCVAQVAQAAETTAMVLDQNRLDQGINMLQAAAERLAEVVGQPQQFGMDHLLLVPELFRCEEPELDPEAVRQAVMAALQQAVTELSAMKEREGRELIEEMQRRLTRLRASLDEVETMAPQAATEAHTRLTERVAQLSTEQVEPQRLAQEVALIADRANINEECERLAIHIEQFAATLAAEGQIAKRLNFLLQEMHREVNTMGSKTNLMEITQAVIEMKEEVESVREQVQNLE